MSGGRSLDRSGGDPIPTEIAFGPSRRSSSYKTFLFRRSGSRVTQSFPDSAVSKNSSHHSKRRVPGRFEVFDTNITCAVRCFASSVYLLSVASFWRGSGFRGTCVGLIHSRDRVGKCVTYRASGTGAIRNQVEPNVTFICPRATI
jgi:hypothetical protein